MKTLTTVLTIIILCFSYNASFAKQSANSILNMAKNRDDGKSFITSAELTLVSKSGKVRKRSFYMLQKDFKKNGGTAIIYFVAPSSVQGVSFLITDYNEVKSGKQWMYLPAFRKVKTIGSNDKSGAFMGSEFNYYDIDPIQIKDYKSMLVGEQKFLSRNCWVIVRKPVSSAVVSKSGYTNTKLWIDKATRLVIKQEYEDSNGVVFKVMKAQVIQNIEGIMTITKARMDNLKKKTSSQLIFKKTKYNVPLDDKLFQVNALKELPRKSLFKDVAL